MAISSEKFEAYNKLQENGKSVTDVTGARNGIISGQGGGMTFEVGDSLTFDPVEETKELDIRLNQSLSNPAWTCTAVNKNGELVEVWPSMLGRVIPVYQNQGNNAFNPTGETKRSIPPQGNISNAYDFWNALKNKTIYCIKVDQANTLSFDRTRIISRKIFTWSYTKPEAK